MTKWFEEVANDASNIVSSRVRLSRNWEEYKFPSRLEPDEARTMIARLNRISAIWVTETVSFMNMKIWN